MQTFRLLLVAVAILFTMPPLSAREAISVDFFYESLEPYGQWRDVGDYGYCWQPDGVEPDWRPYSEGRWVYTDAGWTWDCEEPFGWAVYHYGRWANVGGLGWVWIPGSEWGPGWVAWRRNERYVGWAPLPPEAHFQRGTGFRDWVDEYYDIGPSSYCFVSGRDFGSRRLRSAFINPRENFVLIHQTINITNITIENEHIHNGGPRFEEQARQSEEPLQRYRLERREGSEDKSRRPSEESLRSHVHGDALSVFALPIAGRAIAPPRKVLEKLDRAEIDHGWKNAGTAEDITALRHHMKGQTKLPKDLPTQPKFERPTAAPPAKGTPKQRANENPPPKARTQNQEEDRKPALPPEVKPEPKRPEVKPEPRRPAIQPEPRRPEVKPEPKRPEIKPEPKRPAIQPKPKRPTVQPEPKQPEIKPEPKRPEIKPEPRRPEVPTAPKRQPAANPQDQDNEKPKGKTKQKRPNEATLTNNL